MFAMSALSSRYGLFWQESSGSIEDLDERAHVVPFGYFELMASSSGRVAIDFET